MGKTRFQSMVRAWDLPTRVFHWVLVFSIVSAWVSFRFAEAFGDFTLKWHRWNGYAVLVLLTWRIMWGLVGSSTSRLAALAPRPLRSLAYLRALIMKRPIEYLGHNPLGTWMILALLAVVSAQAVLGLFTVEHNDVVAGPLYRIVAEEVWQKLSKWHIWSFYWVILPLIAVHVASNVLYGVLKGKPHITAMVTGRKADVDYVDGDGAWFVSAPLRRAAMVLVVAIAVVFGSILALGGRLIG